jgi:uncharacterized protein YqeY
MLKEQIQQDMKDTMRAKDSKRLGTIRLLLAAIKQREVDERITLDDAQIISVIEKMLKQRRDSLLQYQNAGRQDLADQESFEMTVLEEYLPEQLSEQELNDYIQSAINESNAVSMKDMGKVMAILKPKILGKADVADVSQRIKSILESKSA